jgi:predicted alpha/beta-hydrolase family hydrolase
MTDRSVTWRIADGGSETTATWDPAEIPSDQPVFVCAHGAGGNMNDRSLLATTAALRRRGLGTVRFNFYYRARHSGRPDPMPRLLACFQAVIAKVREELKPDRLVLGGRSMGGRAASVLVADGEPCAGLLLLAYPLHPPGHPEKLRTAHLGAIVRPTLCVNGTRDAFCDKTLMTQALNRLGANWTMHWVEGADHGFHVLKSSGRNDEDVLVEIADRAADWCRTL